MAKLKILLWATDKNCVTKFIHAFELILLDFPRDLVTGGFDMLKDWYKYTESIFVMVFMWQRTGFRVIRWRKLHKMRGGVLFINTSSPTFKRNRTLFWGQPSTCTGQRSLVWEGCQRHLCQGGKKPIFEQRWWTETSMIQTFTPFHKARWLIVMTPRCQTGSPRKWNQASDPANHARVTTQIVSPRGPSLQALAPAVFRTEEAEEAKCLQEAKPSPVAHRDHALGNNENLKETLCHQQVLKLETFDITLVNFYSLLFSLL